MSLNTLAGIAVTMLLICAFVGVMVSIWKLLAFFGLAAPPLIILGTILIVGGIVGVLISWALNSITIH